MTYISYIKLWENEFDNVVSEKYKTQDINFINTKLEVYDNFIIMKK